MIRVLALAILLAASVPSLAGAITLEWEPADRATGYRVYFGESSGEYTAVQTVGHVTRATLQVEESCRPYFAAISAFNSGGESPLSTEVRAFPDPEIVGISPASLPQGARQPVQVLGANFRPRAELSLDPASVPVDFDGNALITLESFSVVACNRIEALVTVEPTARGIRAMEVGDAEVDLRVINPIPVSGIGSARLHVLFDLDRWDISRDDPLTLDRVDGADLTALAYAYARGEAEPRYHPDADLNGDGFVDGTDLAYLAAGFGLCRDDHGRWTVAACEP
ncbi:MAG: hypothetical protein GY716_18970 [bacterium]|nr:hypothetical protein [bacterium]